MRQDENYNFNPDILGLRRDPESGYRVWRADQIYLGDQTKKGLWVPNVGDKVDFYDGNTLTERRVVSIDESTLIPTLEDISRVSAANKDVVEFRGMGPALNVETWRIFVDKNVHPHTLMLDSSFLVYGNDASYIKIFKGTETGPKGVVISMYRDNPSKAYSENVPLMPVSERFDGSNAVKRPSICHTTEYLEQGELVTIVVYSDAGHKYYELRMLVAEGSNVRALDEPTSYVMGIELLSPFLSTTEHRLLEVPTNMPLDGLFTRAKVSMSDGQDRILAIDQGRMAILGFDNYISTRPSEEGSFALRYLLADNELAWNSTLGETRHITEIYRYRTVEIEGSYAVSISVVPVYLKDRDMYELRYFLHNLERSLWMDITNYVQQGVNSDLFNGRKFGSYQHIAVAVQLEKLGLGLKEFRYVQQFDIGLNAVSDNNTSTYLINYDNDQEIPYGGSNLIQLTGSVATKKFNLNALNNFYSVEDFLNRTYYSSRPIFDPRTAVKAPEPTHMIISDVAANYEIEVPISAYTAEIPVPEEWAVDNKETVLIRFVRKQGHFTHYLTTTGWLVRGNVRE